MSTTFVIGVTALGLYVGILGIKAYLSLRYAGNEPRGSWDEDTLTILQPILSGDPFLETALRHNLKAAPAWARFLWLIDEDDDTARRLAQTLTDTTEAPVRVVLCPAVPPRVNPKIFKLDYALAHVETPYVAVLDDDTLLARNTLSTGLFRLQNGDLFTGLPYYLKGTGLWSWLTAHFVNNNSILTYLPLLTFREPISLNGMFYIMPAQTLRRWGGFTPILPYLCDDYALARIVKKNKGRIIQGTTPVALHTSVPNARSYAALMHRWSLFARTLLFDQPAATRALLLLLLGLPPILLWAGLLCLAPSLPGLLCLAAVLAVRHGTIRYLHRRIFDRPVAFSFLTSILSELLQPFHLIHALAHKRIRWRNRLIRVERDGRFSYGRPDKS